MFTGIVRERGRVVAAADGAAGDRRLTLAVSAALARDLEPGASLAVDGVCLTVVALEDERVDLELSPETLARTTLGSVVAGDRVNLEPALRLGEPLGGHWVQGHVDTVTELLETRPLERHRELAFRLPAEVARWVVEKGSICLSGVSLTVARLEDARFWVAAIPHTLEATTLGELEPGDRLNLEVDVLAKHVERLLAAWRPS
jgi:riboflavin synthase